MRYRGGGVGHVSTWQCDEGLLADNLGNVQDTDSDEALAEPASSGSEGGDDAMDDGPEDKDEDKDKDKASGDDDDQIVIGSANDVDIIAAAGFASL